MSRFISLRQPATSFASWSRPHFVQPHSPRAFAQRRSVCGCTDPSWPLPASDTVKSSDPLAVDYTGHLTQIKPIGRHVLIETPKRGCWDWTPRTPAENPHALPAVIDGAFLKDGSHHKRDPDAGVGGRLLVNRFTTQLTASGRSSDSGGGGGAEVTGGGNAGEDVAYGRILLMPDGIELDVDLSATSPQSASSSSSSSKSTEERARAILDILHTEPASISDLATRHGVPYRTLQRPLFFVCGHMQRDARCGKTAPVLRTAIERYLKERKVDASVGFVDHIGGHKFAGNLLCYLPTPEPTSKAGRSDPARRYTGVWYGRVHLDNLQHVLDETLAGRTVEEMVRLRV